MDLQLVYPNYENRKDLVFQHWCAKQVRDLHTCFVFAPVFSQVKEETDPGKQSAADIMTQQHHVLQKLKELSKDMSGQQNPNRLNRIKNLSTELLKVIVDLPGPSDEQAYWEHFKANLVDLVKLYNSTHRSSAPNRVPQPASTSQTHVEPVAVKREATTREALPADSKKIKKEH